MNRLRPFKYVLSISVELVESWLKYNERGTGALSQRVLFFGYGKCSIASLDLRLITHYGQDKKTSVFKYSIVTLDPMLITHYGNKHCKYMHPVY